MPNFQTKKQIKIVQRFYESLRSMITTMRKFRGIFGHVHAASENAIRNLIKKFKATGSVLNVKTRMRVRNVRAAET